MVVVVKRSFIEGAMHILWSVGRWGGNECGRQRGDTETKEGEG